MGVRLGQVVVVDLCQVARYEGMLKAGAVKMKWRWLQLVDNVGEVLVVVYLRYW